MSNLQIFKNDRFGEIRTIEENGTVLFCGSDVAKALGYTNTRDAINKHCKSDGVVKRDGVSRTTNQYGIATEQTVEMKFINEGNVYRLIMRSKLPAAEQFEHWVFDEVLPSIRKTGGYAPNIEEIIAKTATAVVSEVMKQIVPIITKAIDKSDDPLEDFRLMAIAQPKPRRKIAPGKIRKLDEKIRNHVDSMIISEQYSYRDIANYLEQYGISVSETAICNYRKSAFTNGG